jgi:ferritin-like metal-binding protein YciE
MPDGNGQTKTIHEWLMHIDKKFSDHSREDKRHQEWLEDKLERIDGKLDKKTDKKDHWRLKESVSAVEKKVQHQEVKTAGIAGAMSVFALWIKSFFGG